MQANGEVCGFQGFLSLGQHFCFTFNDAFSIRMKLQPDRFDVQNIIAYGPGWVGLGNHGVAEKIDYSVVIGSRGEKIAWNCTAFEQLTAEHFAQLAELKPELVIFGSGSRLRFPPPALLRALMAQRIGIETMDTLAACRTYNILAGEGRQVVAALLLEPQDAQDPKAIAFESKI